MHYFAHNLPASKIAGLSGVSRAAINQLFMKLQIRIAQVWNASSALSGEVKVSEIVPDTSKKELQAGSWVG